MPTLGFVVRESPSASTSVVSHLRNVGSRVVASGRWWLIPACGAALTTLLCLLVAHEAGFPLDDSWIHQDFARTFALTGRFAFLPGRSGAGSTSPVWVLLLTPPQWIFRGQPPIWILVVWSAILGSGALAGTS